MLLNILIEMNVFEVLQYASNVPEFVNIHTQHKHTHVGNMSTHMGPIVEQQTKPAHACSPMIPYYQNQPKLAANLYTVVVLPRFLPE